VTAVGHLLATITAAAGMFAGTNVDDIIILTVLFLTSRTNGKPRPWQIVAGQYLGFGVLVAISVIGALGLTVVPDRWVGLLGLVPIALGVRRLLKARLATREAAAASPVVAGGLVSVAAVTIANGADNTSVYTPAFRTLGSTDSLVTVAVFATLIAAWCGTASWLGSHRHVVTFVERFGHWLVPTIFVVIGALIVLPSLP
jgi:cadmium resistance transport/sequestration family protein